jgi:protein TonB
VIEQAPIDQGFARQRRKPRIGTIIAIVLLHIAALYGLGRAFAPDFTQSVEQGVVAAFTVTVTTPEEPPPSEPAPEEGAAGEAGERTTPRPETAPRPEIPMREDRPLPEASSDGDEDSSGAQEVGDGSGDARTGIGTGSGRSGGGSGGAAVTKPVLIRSITDARAFPSPPGGREARIGQSVIVKLVVSPQGRVTDCSIYRASPFPETDATVCRLAFEQIRFEPARDRDGNPVSAPFYYRQRFFN